MVFKAILLCCSSLGVLNPERKSEQNGETGKEKTARLINETAPGQLQADGIDSLSGLVVHLRGDGVSLHDVNHQTETERDRECTAEIID